MTQIELNCYYSFSIFSHIKNIYVSLIIKSVSGDVQQEIQCTFPGAVQQLLNVRALGLLSQVPHFIKLHPRQKVEKDSTKAPTFSVLSLFIRKTVFLRSAYCIFPYLSLR